jgi:hypothetical protein
VADGPAEVVKAGGTRTVKGRHLLLLQEAGA